MKVKLNPWLGCLLAALFSLPASGQQDREKQSRIDKVGQDYAVLKGQADKRVVAYLKDHPAKKLLFKAGHSTYLLVDVTDSGIPVYEKTYNDEVAGDLNVKQLRTGGSLGVNILGTGMKVGLWDGGRVLSDHVELIGRVIQNDGAVTIDEHATHVMGTILASGVNPAAKGMAPEANALAYDFNGDVAEMTSISKPDQTTLLLSNHSYGNVAGWNSTESGWSWAGDPAISNTVDFKFGFYDSKARAFDDLAYNAPYYTIVKSAGNDRTDTGDGSRPPDGPYDCISTFGVAKNIITVGAVKKLAGAYSGPNSVEMAAFSSWGPTDDGRIKPDLVAPGVSVFSSTSGATNEYKFFEGTSMATPAVTGTLLLLQQLYKNFNNGNYMRSATLKALAIHTAREAGNAPGPDYSYGWGLLDAEAAGKLIMDEDNQNVFINEGVLSNSQTAEITLSPQQNTKITVTLAWTDPAGTSPVPSLNPVTKMLVNDLDLRLVDDGGAAQFPWTLNPASPSAAAANTQDNARDNVEKIEFANPDPRTYKVRISHKGTLKNNLPQPYSLIITYTSLVDTKTTYYWIGGGGDWNNTAHWSLTSNGPSAGVVPGADHRVVFDENSFSGAATVNLTQDQSCFSFRWFATEAINLSFNNHTLHVNENTLLVSNQVMTPTDGTIYFHGTSSLHQVGLDGNSLDKLGLFFEGNATWEVTGNFQAHKIRIIQGTVNMLDSNPKLDSIITSGPLVKKLKLTNTVIKPLQTLKVFLTPTGTGTAFESLNSTIQVLPSTPPLNLNFGNNTAKTLIDMQGGEVIVSGSGEIDKISGNGKLQIDSNIKIKGLSLSAGSQLILKEGVQPVFTDSLYLAGAAGNKVTVKTTGSNPASLSFDDYYKICFDFLDVQNVNISGQSLVNAGINSTLSNAANWFQENCDDILFPDFTVQYNCVKSAAYFKDNSSGTITKRTWVFGDTGSAEKNQSALKDPVHYFSNPGTYSVSLQVENASKTQQITKQITLLENPLPDNTVALNNGTLISFQPSQAYQWLVDGLILDGATGRTVSFAGNPGEYAVLIFDDTCNKRSAPYLVTAIVEEPVTAQPVRVYPNPASGKLFISKAGQLTIRSIWLQDAIGRDMKPSIEETESEWIVNVTGVNPGLYLLRLNTSAGAEVHKVIIR